MTDPSSAHRVPFPLAAAIGNLLTALLALFLILTGVTLSFDDRAFFGFDAVNGAQVYVVAGFLGIASLLFPRLRLPWLLALTLATLGRSVSLLVVGSPGIIDRDREIVGALGWVVLWVAGLLGYVGARWSEALRNDVLR